MDRFSVLVSYEDVLTHNRSHDVCDRLLDQFWGDLEFDLNWWSFRGLHHEESAAHAAREAARADLIMVAAHAGTTLPPHIQRWCERWAGQRSNHSGILAALVGLPEETGATPIIHWLHQIADRAGMDFLPSSSDSGREHAFPARGTTPNALVGNGLKHLLDPSRPPSHWGINE